MTRSYDYFIVGGGIIGSSIAMSLSDLGANGIAVLDCDLSGKWGSSERNAGGIRVTWDTPVNIALSKSSIDYYEGVAAEVGFRQKGYLWLSEASAWSQVLKRMDLWERSGCEVLLLTPSEITAKFPFLDRLDGVAGAVFSPKDGLINPNLLKTHYRRRIPSDVIDWIDHQVIDRVSLGEDGIRSVRLRQVASEDTVEAFLRRHELPLEPEQEEIRVGTFINAAGAWAPEVARLYDREIPANPIRRQVAVLHCQEADLSPYGMMVDTSGLYFHHEAGNLLAGYAVPSEARGYHFAYEGENYFMTEIWPRLAGRGTCFDRLKLIGGWAGLYGVSPDHHAIIGPVSGLKNTFEAHSFSGHGVMQSYAAGRALAELILQGDYQGIDLSVLSGKRFQSGQLLSEGMLI
ncbi:hypothetical protein MNBD_NITROSPIRAE01-405 [hydrothermal vent metagenome]|uniref:FAD dependent oxidoreductase domain-containing protein n=1 Tax=hydrothermal vent metagenome TaxID=652676 RepID=A0A3B1D348_9ZZZZ